MSFPFLFDVSPDPVPVVGVGGLILLALLVLMFTGALIVGFVFLLKRLMQGSTRRVSNPTAREDLPQTGPAGQFQPSNPNQP
jgi:hypothetical protein